ncbi:phosphopantothenate--cysteine ligase 1-like isoform X1 [Gossypium raimondii]|uniref:phosphopantothenate--cysteine ligase 1-like isoform X1 n=1 Tax=Gossypium raimondii TaxID=29730 RepID=UPI00227BA8DF|nr:phosphopantothenate--cysteine ligase 1-like isoform X1 [Gossypium raimondii]
MLRIIASSMRTLGPHAMFYLVAAVSNFYVPWKSMELVPLKKQHAIAKNGSLPAKKEKQARISDSFESSSEEDSSSDEEAPAKNEILVVAKKGSVPVAKTKKADSSSDPSDDYGSVEK